MVGRADYEIVLIVLGVHLLYVIGVGLGPYMYGLWRHEARVKLILMCHLTVQYLLSVLRMRRQTLAVEDFHILADLDSIGGL